jgi:hypothetical protein
MPRVSVASPPNGWTVATLKTYMDQRFGDSDKAVAAALQAADKAVQAALLAQKEAVLKAEIATDKRFETARIEADFRMNALGSKIDELQAIVNQSAGRSLRDERDEDRHYESGAQARYLGVYAVIGVVLVVLGGLIGHLVH